MAKLGINLSTLGYGNTEQPFLNIIKTVNDWVDSNNLSTTLSLDSDCYPTAIPGGASYVRSAVRAGMATATGCSLPYDAGTYVFLYSDNGSNATFSFGGDSGGGSDVSSATKDGALSRYVLTVATPTVAGIRFQCTHMDASHHPTNMALIYSPGSALGNIKGSRETLYDNNVSNGQVWGGFDPVFLSLMAPFKQFRFVKWMNVSRSVTGDPPFLPQTFSQRSIATQFGFGPFSSSTYFTYAAAPGPLSGGNPTCPIGAPIEVMCALCNQLNADAWFNMPPLTTGPYYSSFATQAKASLNTNRTAYVEYGNEAWNGAEWTYYSGIAGGFVDFPGTKSYSSVFLSGCNFNGTISSGTTLTVNSVTNGSLVAGQSIFGTGVVGGQTLASGSGANWVLGTSQSNVGPEAMTMGWNNAASYCEYAYQSVLNQAAWAGVWSGADRSRYVAILGGWAANWSQFFNTHGQAGYEDFICTLAGTDYGAASLWTSYCATHFNVYSIAPYFDTPNIGTDTTAAEVLADMTANGIPVATTNVINSLAYLTTNAVALNNIGIIGYESGATSHATVAFAAASIDPGIRPVYTSYYRNMVAAGLTTLNHFDSIESYQFGAFWGAMESWMQSGFSNSVPKYRALIDFASSAVPPGGRPVFLTKL